MDTLVSHLNSIHPLSEQLHYHLLKVLKTGRVGKKQYLLKMGSVCRNIYFIQSGLIRHFRPGEGDGTTLCFMKENDVVYSACSFYNQSPSSEFIQAIEPTEYYYMSLSELLDTFSKFREFNGILWQLTAHYHERRTQDDYALRMPLAGDRLKYMMNNRPEFVLRVPRKLLASYLGCTPVTLSRVWRWG